jgi:hypothetical protein
MEGEPVEPTVPQPETVAKPLLPPRYRAVAEA